MRPDDPRAILSRLQQRLADIESRQHQEAPSPPAGMMAPGELFDLALAGQGLANDEMLAVVDAGLTEEEAFYLGPDNLWYCSTA